MSSVAAATLTLLLLSLRPSTPAAATTPDLPSKPPKVRIWTCGDCALNRLFGLGHADSPLVVTSSTPRDLLNYEVTVHFQPSNQPIRHRYFEVARNGSMLELRAKSREFQWDRRKVQGKLVIQERGERRATKAGKTGEAGEDLNKQQALDIQIVFVPGIASMLLLFLATHLISASWPSKRPPPTNEHYQVALLRAWKLARAINHLRRGSPGRKFPTEEIQKEIKDLARLELDLGDAPLRFKSLFPTKNDLENTSELPKFPSERPPAKKDTLDPPSAPPPLPLRYAGIYSGATLASLVLLFAVYSNTSIAVEVLFAAPTAAFLGLSSPALIRILDRYRRGARQ